MPTSSSRDMQAPGLGGFLAEGRLLRSHQDAELFLFSGSGAAELRSRLERFRGVAEWISRAELGDAAAALAGGPGLCDGRCRIALVASTPEDLTTGLEQLLTWIDEGVTSGFDKRAGLFLGTRSDDQAARVGFLFPGQGSPVRAEGGIWSRRFSEVRETYEAASLSTDPGAG